MMILRGDLAAAVNVLTTVKARIISLAGLTILTTNRATK